MTWLFRFLFNEIFHRIDRLEIGMATIQEAFDAVTARMTDIGNALTGIADDIAALKAQIGGLTHEQQSQLDGIIARVNETAAAATALDAANPAP